MSRGGFSLSRLSFTALLLALPALVCTAAVPGPGRQQELLYLLRQDCGSCHGMTLKGGLGPSLLPEALAGKPAHYLHQVISQGVPDRAMPPWRNILAPEEIDFLVELLLEGVPE